MPIEFRCTSCSKLLRTPDESAGKKAKCPQCGAIVDVPESSQAGHDEGVPTGDVARDPFARPAEPQSQPQPQLNPYAAPTSFAAPFKEDVPLAELRHATINFDEILQTTWTFFTENMGPLAIFGVVVFAINAGLQIVGQIGGMATQASGEIALIVGFSVINTVVGILIGTFINLGTVIYMLKMLRTRQATLNDLFAAGPYFLKGLLLTFLLVLIVLGLVVVCLGPGMLTIPLEEAAVTVPALILGFLVYFVMLIVVLLRFALCMFFLVDRDAGVVESLTLSAQYMAGNKLTTFLIFLVVSILGGLFVCCTLFFGQILYIPYWGILTSMIYLTATGQMGATALNKPAG